MTALTLVAVSKSEFDAFIADYPRPLTRATVAICYPPSCVYYDLSLGDAHGRSFTKIVARYDEAVPDAHLPLTEGGYAIFVSP